jgi:hypothetical protein
MFRQSYFQSIMALPPLRKWMSLWRKFCSLPLARQLLLLRIGLLLILIRVSLVLLPFGMLQAMLEQLAGWRAKSQQVDDRQTILQATRSLGRRLLGDSPCLTEALTVQTLFRRRGYPAELRIGVVKSPPGELLAHAWVESAGAIVIGGGQSPIRFTAFPTPIQRQKLHR